MQFTFVVCNETEIMDRQTREVIGRIRAPRWYGDFWRATLASGSVEEPTQSQLRVTVQKKLDRLTDPTETRPARSEPEEDALFDEPLRPRRPVPQKPDHVKQPPPVSAVPPQLARPVNYSLSRRVRVFAQRNAAASKPAADTEQRTPTATEANK